MEIEARRSSIALQATTLRLIPQNRWRWRWRRRTKVKYTTAAFSRRSTRRVSRIARLTDPASSEMQPSQTNRPVLKLGSGNIYNSHTQKRRTIPLVGGVGMCWTVAKDRKILQELCGTLTQLTLDNLNPATLYTYGLDPKPLLSHV